MPYIPEHLNRYTRADNYVGPEWNDYYLFLGRSRDSDALEESNFQAGLEAIGGESDTVLVIRDSHWVVGWVETIYIHESDETALRVADGIRAALEDYPVVNEEHFSELEFTRAADFWDSLSPRDKVEMAMEERRRYHWLDREPVWRFGRMDYVALCNDGSTIAQALTDRLRA